MKATAGSNVLYPTGFNPGHGPHKAINGDLDDRFHFVSQRGAKFGWMAVDLKKICKVLLDINYQLTLYILGLLQYNHLHFKPFETNLFVIIREVLWL